ncbi:MAG: FG-GAP-like repeat-containing protein [Candidatus Aegiribacteria sp.]|nr:FG-GAP-like repeat-containing protein [Candidatus Aegiribacteria sp.]
MKSYRIILLKASTLLSVMLFVLITDTHASVSPDAHHPARGICSSYSDNYLDLESPVPGPLTAPVPMPNWPQSIGMTQYYPPSGVCLADIFGDGFLEIIATSSNGSVHVFDYQGNDIPGWPKTGLEQIRSKVAVGDIDSDYPGLEIVAVGVPCTLYVWHSDGTPVPGWPRAANLAGHLRAPVIFDVDGDGDLEIILGKGDVCIYNHDGTIYPGWPQSIGSVATPSVADVDNDGVVEICAVSYNSIYLWDKDGNPEPGWPLIDVAGATSYAQPVLADLDDDGDLEILHAHYDQWSVPSQNHVAIYHHDGTNFNNWPFNYPGPHTYITPVVGDIDNDDDLEIFGGGHTFDLQARHHTGAIVSGWPVSALSALECSPIVFDVDGDGFREVVFGENWPGANGFLYAFNGDGSAVEDWPISINAPSYVNSAAVGDVDDDGDIEIAFMTGNGTVNLWTIENVPYRPYLTEWGTYFHDNWNTGWMHPLAPLNPVVFNSGAANHLTWNANTELDIAGYNIYRSDISGGPYTKINGTVVTDTLYSDASGTIDHFYCISAVIMACTESRLSVEATTQTGIAATAYEQYGSFNISSFPNPFSANTTISFSVPIELAGNAELSIYDLNGRRVKTLFNEIHPAGDYSIIWDATDDLGRNSTPGIYFYRLRVGSCYGEIKKVTLLHSM